MNSSNSQTHIAYTLQSAVVTAVTANEDTSTLLDRVSERVIPDIAEGITFESATVDFEMGTVPEESPNFDVESNDIISREVDGATSFAIRGESEAVLVLYGVPDDSVDDEVLLNCVDLLAQYVSEDEDAETESRLDQQRRNFMKLHSVAAQMVSSQSEIGIFQLAIDAAQSVISFDFCRIDTFDESGNLVPEMTTNGLPGDETSQLSTDEGFTRHVLEEERQIIINDIEEHEFSLGIGEYRSAVGVPIEDIGVFMAASERPDAFDSYDADIADLLMAYVGQTLSSIRSKAALKESKERLETQKNRLELLNRILRHDVRNDMQMVLGSAELLRDEVDDDGDEHVKTIRENVDHVIELTTAMRGLMDDMLSDDAALEPIDIESVIEESISDVRGTYDDGEVVVDGSIPSTQVSADSMLQSVFRNLITNGINHNNTKATPEVQVSASEENESIVIDVADNGPGIPDEQKDELFDIGEKGESSSGTGVGLYLVKTLVERYGGDISVHDNTPDGTIFTVALQKAGSG